jgi:hypothetical protein
LSANKGQEELELEIVIKIGQQFQNIRSPGSKVWGLGFRVRGLGFRVRPAVKALSR